MRWFAVNDILREFLVETGENLAQLDLDLVTLEKEPGERETLARVFRTLHTVKGTAGFLGLVKLQAVAHAGENLLGRLRALVKDADPEIVEEWKWRGVPVWSHDGIVCTGETYKNVVKMTFAKGAALDDPTGLFNSSLEGNTRRAIDFHEGEKIDERALKTLVRAAVTLNTER